MAGLIPLLAAAAALHTIDVPDSLGRNVERAKERSGLPVLIPDAFQSDFRKLYPDVRTEDGFYELDLGAAPNCGGGGACGIAYFFGEQDGQLRGARVQLHDGITGRYQKIKCGASCSPPIIGWRVGGVEYAIGVKGLPGKQRKQMKRLANQAIDAGPR